MNKVLLREIADITQGNTPSRGHPEYWNGSIPWIPTALIQNQIITKEMVAEYITEEGLQKTSMKVFPRGTVLMAMIGQGKTRGQVAILDLDATINQNAAAMIFRVKDIDPKFIYYQLRNMYGEIRAMSNGAGQQNLNAQLIGLIVINLPSLAIQKQIVSILDSWDSAIEKTERLIELKQKRADWLFEHLLRQRRDIWKNIDIEELFCTISDRNHPEEELLSATQDRGVVPRYSLPGRVMSPTGDVSAYKLIQPGDFAVSLRSFQGGLEYSEHKGIISPAYTVLRPRVKIDNSYFKYFLKSSSFINFYLSQAVIGIRDGKQISIPDLMELSIPVPPLNEQKTLGQALSCLAREQDLLQQKYNLFQKQKSFLMSKLLSGEWEAPDLAQRETDGEKNPPR